MGLEAEIDLEVLRDLTNQTLERKLADEELGVLLVLSDLTKSDSAGPASEQESDRIIDYNIHKQHDVSDRHLKRWGFLTPPVDGADFLAALHAIGLRGACTTNDTRYSDHFVCVFSPISPLPLYPQPEN